MEYIDYCLCLCGMLLYNLISYNPFTITRQSIRLLFFCFLMNYQLIFDSYTCLLMYHNNKIQGVCHEYYDTWSAPSFLCSLFRRRQGKRASLLMNK